MLQKHINIKIVLGEEHVIQEKFVNILPSKEGYLLPINKDVFDELESTIQNNGYESDINIKLSYYHNVSRKQKYLILQGKLSTFNTYSNKSIYELQFVNN